MPFKLVRERERERERFNRKHTHLSAYYVTPSPRGGRKDGATGVEERKFGARTTRTVVPVRACTCENFVQAPARILRWGRRTVTRCPSPRRASCILALPSRLVVVLGAAALLGGASTPVQARQAGALSRASSPACAATFYMCAYLHFASAKNTAKKKKAGGTRGIGACSEMHAAKDAMAAAERFAAAGKRGQERECWERAAELDDENPEPLTRLGNMAHLDGKLQAARTMLEQALAMAPASAHVHSSIASVEYSLGGPHFALAVRHYQAQFQKSLSSGFM